MKLHVVFFFWEWAILVVMVEAKVPTFWCLNLKHHLKEVDHYHFHLSELAFIHRKPCEILQHLFQVQPIFCFQLTSLSISPSLAFTTHFFVVPCGTLLPIVNSYLPTEGCSWPHLLTSNVQASIESTSWSWTWLLSNEKKQLRNLAFYDTRISTSMYW